MSVSELALKRIAVNNAAATALDSYGAKVYDDAANEKATLKGGFCFKILRSVRN
ncbi:hypothetical protein [Polynucleobacter sinensis]|uniref:hypothetical protein n=1 Tax=Polynucleobacter sinensis TaxID=1743157 RepID=UPI000A861092|nr:hypothetical protein [Polynucleobacter sinensis]